MFNQEVPRLSGYQLSLFELFFVTTLLAVGLGVYIYVSPVLAMLAGGLWIVIAIVNNFSPSNPLSGGLIGFAAASTITLLVAPLLRSEIAIVGLSVVFPSLGYFCGACTAGFQDDSI